MNPSYNNGGTNAGGQQTPGVKPGVIASGPDPEDAPTIPVGAPNKPMSLGGSGRSRVSSLLGKVKSPKPAPSQPIQFGGGGGEKKSKKGLIIGALAIVVILIVVLVVVMMMGGGKKGGSGDTASGGDYDNFLRYANYMISGNENTNNDLGNFDSSKDYAATMAYVENNKNFFDKAQNLWKAFYEKYINEANKTDVSQIVGDIEHQNQLMDFAVRYMNTTEMDDHELLELYLKDGLDGAKTQVDNHYKNLFDTTFEPGKEYATALINHAKSGLNLCSVYAANGCIENGDVNATCVRKNNAAIISAQTEYNEEEANINNKLIGRVMSELEEFCFKINNDFGGEND